MKKFRMIPLLALLSALLLSGCGGASFSFTQFGGSMSVEVSGAKDGDSAESSVFSVGAGRVAVIESALESGALELEFAEATVFRRDDLPDEVVVGDVLQSVTVGAGDGETVALDAGDYVLRATAKGDTAGKVSLSIEKP